jgi:probable HAF family extracellular repeat protein
MKSRLCIWMSVACLFGTLNLVVDLNAQAQKHQLPGSLAYTVIDLGTVGGPQANIAVTASSLSSRNQLVGAADTATRDPNYPNFNPFLSLDPFIQHAVLQQGGMRNDLGALPGLNSSYAFGVNTSGMVAGISENGMIDPLTGYPEGHAVLWSGGQITDLGTLGGNESLAYGINSAGAITGGAANTIADSNSFFGWGTQTRAFVWTNGMMQDIGTLGGTDAVGYYVNDAMQVVGQSYTSTGAVDPFIWANNQMQDMGSLGGTYGNPEAFNQNGQSAGYSYLAGDSAIHAFLWSNGTMTDLGVLGTGSMRNYSEAYALNDNGDVVGEADAATGIVYTHGVLWKNGGVTDLGVLPGDNFSTAWGVNSNDQVVGTSGRGFVPMHAFVWQNGQMTDLNTFAPANTDLIAAFYVNDAGCIGAVGYVAGGGNGNIAYTNNQHAFLLLPRGGGSDQNLAPANAPADTIQQIQKSLRDRFHGPGQLSQLQPD